MSEQLPITSDTADAAEFKRGATKRERLMALLGATAIAVLGISAYENATGATVTDAFPRQGGPVVAMSRTYESPSPEQAHPEFPIETGDALEAIARAMRHGDLTKDMDVDRGGVTTSLTYTHNGDANPAAFALPESYASSTPTTV
jgi:hypothetical protein